MKSHS